MRVLCIPLPQSYKPLKNMLNLVFKLIKQNLEFIVGGIVKLCRLSTHWMNIIESDKISSGFERFLGSDNLLTVSNMVDHILKVTLRGEKGERRDKYSNLSATDSGCVSVRFHPTDTN